MEETLQGLIQNEKEHIDCEKGAQISIFTNKIATSDDSILPLRSPNELTLHLVIIFSLLCSHYVIDLIKKLETRFLVVSIFLKIKFGMPKFVSSKSVYRCQKQHVSTLAL